MHHLYKIPISAIVLHRLLLYICIRKMVNKSFKLFKMPTIKFHTNGQCEITLSSGEVIVTDKWRGELLAEKFFHDNYEFNLIYSK